jgi:hypothetical protein
MINNNVFVVFVSMRALVISNIIVWQSSDTKKQILLQSLNMFLRAFSRFFSLLIFMRKNIINWKGWLSGYDFFQRSDIDTVEFLDKIHIFIKLGLIRNLMMTLNLTQFYIAFELY